MTQSFEDTLNALQKHMQTQKESGGEIKLEPFVKGYLLPLIKSLRAEAIETFDVMEERVADLEEEAVDGQAAEIIDASKDLVGALVALLNNVCQKLDYVDANGAPTDKMEEPFRTQFLSTATAIQGWGDKIRKYEADVDDLADDDDDEDDGDDPDGGEKLAKAA